MDNLTRYLVAALLLVWSTPNFVLGQVIMTGHHRLIGTSVPVCPPPTGATTLSAAHNPLVTCWPGGVSCVNTDNIFDVPDLGSAGNVLKNEVTQSTSPTYTTSGVGTNSVFTFVGSNLTRLVYSSQIFPVGSPTLYWTVIKPSVSGTDPVFNSDATISSGCLNSVAWSIQSGHSVVDNCFIANIFNDTANNYGGIAAELFVTLNFSTGAYTFGHCNVASGCVQDGSGTNSSVTALSVPSNTIGAQIYAPNYSNALMAEFGVQQPAPGSLTSLATYFACQYPTI